MGVSCHFQSELSGFVYCRLHFFQGEFLSAGIAATGDRHGACLDELSGVIQCHPARWYQLQLRQGTEAFAKGNNALKVSLVSIGGKLLAPSELGTLAKMPTYEQAISQLMSVMKAPVQKLAATINEVPGKLVRTLAAVRDAKEAA